MCSLSKLFEAGNLDLLYSNVSYLTYFRLMQVSVSVKRLHNYLRNEELNTKNLEKTNEGASSINIENGLFMWDKDEPEATLQEYVSIYMLTVSSFSVPGY